MVDPHHKKTPRFLLSFIFFFSRYRTFFGRMHAYIHKYRSFHMLHITRQMRRHHLTERNFLLYSSFFRALDYINFFKYIFFPAVFDDNLFIRRSITSRKKKRKKVYILEDAKQKEQSHPNSRMKEREFVVVVREYKPGIVLEEKKNKKLLFLRIIFFFLFFAFFLRKKQTNK